MWSLKVEVKLIELRDCATFIPAIAISVQSPEDGFLVRAAGYGHNRTVLFGRLDGNGKLNCDPYEWRDRTWSVAHHWLEEHWDELKSEDVVDVEFILAETPQPKRSQRHDG